MEYYDIIIKSKDKEGGKKCHWIIQIWSFIFVQNFLFIFKLQNMLFGTRWEQKAFKVSSRNFRISLLVKNGEREKFENMLKAALVIHKQQQFSIKKLKVEHEGCRLISSFFMISSREINFLPCCRHLKDFWIHKTFSSLRFLLVGFIYFWI